MTVTNTSKEMSLNFIQSALQKSIHHPELYSPSVSPIDPSTPVVEGVPDDNPRRGHTDSPEQTPSAKLRESGTIATSSEVPVASKRLRKSTDSVAKWLQVAPCSSPQKNQTQTSSAGSFDIYEYARKRPEEYDSLIDQDQQSPEGKGKMIIPQPAITASTVRAQEEGDSDATQTMTVRPYFPEPPPALHEIPVEVAERAPETLTPITREALTQPRMTRAQKAAAEKAAEKARDEEVDKLRDWYKQHPWGAAKLKQYPLDDPDPTPNSTASEEGGPSSPAFNPFIDTETHPLYETGEPSTSDQGAWNEYREGLLHSMFEAEDRRQSPDSNSKDGQSQTQTTGADEATEPKAGDSDDASKSSGAELASAMLQKLKARQENTRDQDLLRYEPKILQQAMEVPTVDQRMDDTSSPDTGKETVDQPPVPTLSPPMYLPQEEREVDSKSDSDISTAAGGRVQRDRHGVIDMACQSWILHQLQKNGVADCDDSAPEGFGTEAPKDQLTRAKNFLASGSVERTAGWNKKFDALCQYAKYLLDEYEHEDWGKDLFDVVKQLRAHRIWEKYMYSPPKLDLDISNGKGQIYPGPKRFYYDQHSVVDFEKNYRPPGAPRFDHERGSLAGKSPGLFIEPHCIEDPPKNAHIDPLAFNKGMKWFTSEQQKWVNWTAEHALKEAYGHKRWKQRKEDIMPLPPAANWNGPVVNVSMDKEMYKTYQKVKKYEAMIAKLRRTVWKTAVYGERPVLLKCLEGIDHGLYTGQGWTTLPSDGSERPVDEVKKKWEKLPVRPLEWEWLEFLTLTSPSNLAPKKLAPQKAVFMERLVRLLNNPRDDGIFAKFVDSPTKTPVPELTEAINLGLKKGDVQRGPRKLYIFNEEEVWEYAEIAEELGMVHRIEQRVRGGKMARGVGELAIRGLLPEERIRWSGSAASTQAKEQEEEDDDDEEEESSEEEDDDSSDDSVSIASTISTQISIPASGTDYGDYSRGLPYSNCLLPWSPTDRSGQQTKADKIRTAKFYRRLGARLGLQLHNLQKDLKAMGEALSQTDGKVRQNQMFLFDTLAFWKDDYNKRTQNRKNPAANDERQVPLYKDIVSVADPDSQDRKWKKKDSWADAEEAEAREIVRRGIIREIHENKTSMWTARGDTSSEPGGKFPSWRCEDLWSFGAPGARGFESKRFFSLNRWPVHLQEDEIQKEIKSSGPPPREAANRQKISEEQAVEFAPANIVDDGQKTIWRPGNEYWLGATPRQQRAIWRRTHQLGGGPEKKQTWGGKLASLFSRKRKRDQEDIEQDDIDSFEMGSLRLPSPGFKPKILENPDAAERKAKAMRLSG